MRRWIAPRAQEGGDHELTIKIIGGLPEQYSPLPNCRRSRLVASIHLLFVYFPRLWGRARPLCSGTAFGSQTGP